jgi:hypothetical protein
MGDLLKTLRDVSSAGQPLENPLANLLDGILGGAVREEDAGTDASGGIDAQAGITPDIAQAVMALVAGQRTSKGASGKDEAKSGVLDELLEQARGGEAVDETALRASGLPQNLAKSTGLDLSEAIRVLQKLLPSLAAMLGIPGSKPSEKPKSKPKPRSAAKPRPATKPRAVTKPKPKRSTASRPKPSTSAAKPAARPATTRRRRKPDKGDAGGPDLKDLLEHA